MAGPTNYRDWLGSRLGVMKFCSACREDKPFSEFNKNRRTKSGYQSQCRECHQAHKVAYRAAHPEKVKEWDSSPRRKASQAAYIAANREKRNAYAAAYGATHPRDRRAYNAAWRAANLEQIRARDRERYQREKERQKAYRESHREERRAWARGYYQAHREAMCEGVRRRKHRNAVVPFTLVQLEAKLAYWGGKCWMCGDPFEHWDHVKPIAKGGLHILSNLRPACARCNHKKSSKWPLDLERAA